MSDRPLSPEEFARQLQGHYEAMSTQGGWRNLKAARLGNGGNPSQVIVPPDKAIAPGMLYAYTQTDGGREVVQVLNLYGGLSYDEGSAHMPITIGFPPKSTTLSIYGPDPGDGLQFTGGALPSQIAAIDSRYVTPERFAALHLGVTGDSLTLTLTDGWLRFGPTSLVYVPANEAFADLTDYVPTDPDTGIYVQVGIDNGLSPILTAGSPFPTTSTDPVTFIPTTLQAGVSLLGVVYLATGTTILSQNQVVNIPDIYYVPMEGDGGGTGTGGVVLSDSTPSPTEAGMLWFNTSTSQDALLLRNKNDDAWNFPVRLGNAANPWYGLFTYQVGYRGVYTAISILSGEISLTDELVSVVLPLESETGTTDDLTTITMTGETHYFFVVMPATGHTITLKHGTGNIYFNDEADHVLDGDKVCLMIRILDKVYGWP